MLPPFFVPGRSEEATRPRSSVFHGLPASPALEWSAPKSMAREIKANTAAPGIAIAKILHMRNYGEFIPSGPISEEAHRGRVRQRFDAAVVQAAKALELLMEKLRGQIAEADTDIYHAQLAILQDPGLREDVDALHPATSGSAPRGRCRRAVAKFEQAFSELDHAPLRERASDIRDVGRQLLNVLLRREQQQLVGSGRRVRARGGRVPALRPRLDRDRARSRHPDGGGRQVLARGDPREVHRHPLPRRSRRESGQAADGRPRDPRRRFGSPARRSGAFRARRVREAPPGAGSGQAPGLRGPPQRAGDEGRRQDRLLRERREPPARPSSSRPGCSRASGSSGPSSRSWSGCSSRRSRSSSSSIAKCSGAWAIGA